MIYQPKVTIIIPVYNGSNFLTEAIESALAQTYPHCEILVINDGSCDDGASERIAKSYGNRITYFRKENGGVSTALNFAFTRMSGEWFSWLSHDDLYYPQKIERQVAFLNELLEKKPGIDLTKITVRSATESIDRDGRIIKKPSYRDVATLESTIDTIIGNVFNYRLSGCSFLLPAACVNDVGGFAEHIRTVSDVEYWYRLLFAGYQFYCLSNDVLVKNRSHGKQVGKTKVTLFDQELCDLFMWIADKMNENCDFGTRRNNERLYCAFVKRGCMPAANYVKLRYLTYVDSSNFYRAKLRIYKCMFGIVGNMRNVARFCFRKLFVK